MDTDILIVMLLGLTIVCYTIYKIADRILRHIELVKGVRLAESNSKYTITVGGIDDDEEE